MKAFIALDKYIFREELLCGVGVPVSEDEEIAKYESCRKKNVKSFNQWLEIEIPEKDTYLQIDASIKEQSPYILKSLENFNFLQTLFFSECNNLVSSFKNNASEEEKKELYTAFLKEKYENIYSLDSALDLFTFINNRCKNNDKVKSSALLYYAGIKGFLYNDEKGERILMYNAYDDIEVELIKKTVLENSIVVL